MPKDKNYKDDDLALLTEEERAGLLEDGEADGEDGDDLDDEIDEIVTEVAATKAKEEADVKAAAEGDEDSDDEGDDDGDGTELTAEQIAANEKAVADAAVTKANDEADDDGDATAEPVKIKKAPIPTFNVPADATDQLAAMKARKRELATKFDDGEITREEFTAETENLDDEREALKSIMDRATIAHDNAVQEWTNTTIPSFMSDTAHAQYAKSKFLYNALDMKVKELQGSAEYPNPFDPDILERAHQAVMNDIAEATGQPIAKKTTPAAKVEKSGKKAKGLSELPPTLGSIPAASGEEINDQSGFAHLDRLAEKDGLAFEAALAKLSDADRERYLAAN